MYTSTRQVYGKLLSIQILNIFLEYIEIFDSCLIDEKRSCLKFLDVLKVSWKFGPEIGDKVINYITGQH